MTSPSVVGADGSDPLPARTVLRHQPDDEGGRQAVASYALLLDGTTVEIRPVRADDLAGLLRLHERMSHESMYLRFFGVSRAAAEQIATRLCRDPTLEGHALVACLRGEIVGVAHHEEVDTRGAAEMAVVVADQVHHRGVGTLLIEHLASIARQHGVKAFRAEVLGQNQAMLRVFADAGLHAETQAGAGVVTLTVPLTVDDTYLDAVAERERRADIESLRPMLRPSTVAVIGASRTPGSVGRAILDNAQSGGFPGTLYVVNPNADRVAGLPSFPTAAALPEPPDLAVVAVPAAAVCRVAEDCGRRGTRALVVVTSGLDHIQGADLLTICRRYGMRLVGPNCFGIADTTAGLNLTFGVRPPVAGSAGVVVQSGGVGIALLAHLARLEIGVSSFVSVGDKYDVSSNDLLRWWPTDQATRLGVLYLESFGNPRKFARIARQLSRSMPLLTVLAGRSDAGARAAASHTAAAATPAVTRAALFGQAGVIATPTLGELVDSLALIGHQPLPSGPRVAVVSNAGGAGVLAADACIDAGLVVPVVGKHTQETLSALLPTGAACAGPVDTTAAVPAHVFGQCIQVVAADDGVDALLAVVVPTALSDPGTTIRPYAGKSVLAVAIDQPETVVVSDGVPSYATPEGAARALARAWSYARWRQRPAGHVPELADVSQVEARQIIGRFLTASPDGGWLPTPSAMELLAAYRLPVAEWRWTSSEAEAVEAAVELASPVALKADVADVVHKTDVGAVSLALSTEDGVRRSYRAMVERFGDRLRGVLVQPMAAPGVEVLAGVVQEPVFGPLVVFGLGGVATDVLADRATRLAPLTDIDAAELVRAPRAAALLQGYRGQPPVDMAGLEQALIRLAKLASDHPEITEVDLNPVIARPDGVVAVDVRVRLQRQPPSDPFLRRLR
jgi:acyl-CoA synthetase (NDP forming)/GNAT superfamily N-acetyltransferase